jgi:hypothetical protein
LDCRRANLKVVTKEEACRHHRVRRDSKSGVKGVQYNAETDTWSANVYRNGRAHHVGTFYAQEEAVAAYEAALRKENPDLHSAPARVERDALHPRPRADPPSPSAAPPVDRCHSVPANIRRSRSSGLSWT